MDEFKRGKIFYTIVNDNYEEFLLELEQLENINVVDINRMSLLHFCCEYSRLRYAEKLLEKNIKLGLKDRYGNQAFWKATFNARGNYDLVKLLLEYGAEPDIKNKSNRSPRDMAITFDDERLIGLLSEPNIVYYAAWEELAQIFNYEIKEDDQDWTYMIAEAGRIDEYFAAYEELENKEAKFSLGEILIQAVNDQSDVDFEKYWAILAQTLSLDFELHKPTIYYWCVWMNDDLADCFRISEKMRNYWVRKIKENEL